MPRASRSSARLTSFGAAKAGRRFERKAIREARQKGQGTDLYRHALLREAIRRSRLFYLICAHGRALWYALLETISRVFTKLRGRETLLGIDFLPSREATNAEFAFELMLCLRFKNEAPNLKEWLEYHHMVGVQHFALYNNNSTDDYRSVLDPYVNKLVHLLKDWPAVPASPSATTRLHR